LSPRATILVKTACNVNAGCLETGIKTLGSMTSFTAYCSIANIWSCCTCSPRDLCDVTHISLVEYTHKVNWL